MVRTRCSLVSCGQTEGRPNRLPLCSPDVFSKHSHLSIVLEMALVVVLFMQSGKASLLTIVPGEPHGLETREVDAGPNPERDTRSCVKRVKFNAQSSLEPHSQFSIAAYCLDPLERRW